MIDNRTPAGVRVLAMGVLMALLAGCQSGGTRSTDAPMAATTAGADSTDAAAAATLIEDPLLARATERWQLLIAAKFSEAYEYLSPGYREVVDREEYVQTMARRQVFWTSAVASDRDCADQLCRVRVDIIYKVKLPTLGVGEVESSTTVYENWIEGTDGRWFLVPDRAS